MKRAGLSLLLLLTLATSAQAASQRLTNKDICETYANDALRDVQLASGTSCPYITGPRWTTSFQAHFNFCMQHLASGDSATVDQEKNARHNWEEQCTRGIKQHPSGPGSN